MLGKEALQNYGTWQSTQLPSSWRLLKNSEIEKMDIQVDSEVHSKVKFTVALAMATESVEATIVVNLLVAIAGTASAITRILVAAMVGRLAALVMRMTIEAYQPHHV